MKVLVIDDTPEVTDSVRSGFSARWRDTEVVGRLSGDGAAEIVERERPDVVILDAWLPDVDGYDVLRQIRAFSDVPVLMVSCTVDLDDKVRAFDSGADDYIGKPFDSRELVARAGRVLRRLDLPVPPAATPPFRADGLEIDFAKREVRLGGRPVELTPTEYRILYHLARNAGRVVPREALITRIWGADRVVDEVEALRVFIGRLRTKLGDDAAEPRFIRTERGVGYRFIVSRPTEPTA